VTFNELRNQLIVCEHGRVNLSLLAAVFGIVFVAELPDKTALASLVLGTRYRPVAVFTGVAAAFALHVIIAVAAGSALSLAPRRIVESVVAVLFLAGAVVMLRRGRNEHDEPEASAGSPPAQSATAESGDERPLQGTMAVLTRTGRARTNQRVGVCKVAATSFAVLFVAEFGDLTQIATANLAARYHDPLAVGPGAVLGLWAVGGLAILGGRQLLRWVDLTWIARIAALIMATLGVLSAVHAITG
jgi:putative Ca2+/H+ antiporter (TMEM165/GDT1 family)